MFLKILLIIILVFVIIQDLKYRLIHFSLPILILICSLFININNDGWIKSMINSSFIVLTMLGVVLYFSIKEKKIFNPINKNIGLGDLLFFIAITPLFSLHSYVLFFITGLILSMILYLVFLSRNTTIPLAGYLSIYLISFIFFDSYSSKKIFDLIYLF